MIDLTNYNHKRGVVILTSKDMRCVCDNLFNYKVNSDCVKSYIAIMADKIDEIEMSKQDRMEFKHYIKTINDWVDKANTHIEKARETFR